VAPILYGGVWVTRTGVGGGGRAVLTHACTRCGPGAPPVLLRAGTPMVQRASYCVQQEERTNAIGNGVQGRGRGSSTSGPGHGQGARLPTQART